MRCIETVGVKEKLCLLWGRGRLGESIRERGECKEAMCALAQERERCTLAVPVSLPVQPIHVTDNAGLNFTINVGLTQTEPQFKAHRSM
jgi:hypothetical protein